MLQPGDLCEVIYPYAETRQYYGLLKGDTVEVRELYPHVVYVGRLGGGYKMRQSILRNQ